MIDVGINAADIIKLKNASFHTVAVSLRWPWALSAALTTLAQSVHNATSRVLLKIKGFSDVKVDRIKQAVKTCMVRSVLPRSLI